MMRSLLTIAMVLGSCGIAAAGSAPLPAFIYDAAVQKVEEAKLNSALAAASHGNLAPLRTLMDDQFMKAVDSREDQGEKNFLLNHREFGPKFVLAEKLLDQAPPPAILPPTPPPVTMPPTPPPVTSPAPPVMACPPSPTGPPSPPVVIPPVVTPPSPGGSPTPGGGPPLTSPGPGGAVPEPSSLLMLGTGLIGLIGWRRWVAR